MGKGITDESQFSLDVRDNDIKAVKKWLKEGIDIDVKAMFGWTALHLAIFKGLEDMTKLLIKKKASLSIQSDDGKSPMHWAVLGDSAKIVTMLLEAGAPVDIEDNNNKTPIWYVENPSATKPTKEVIKAFTYHIKHYTKRKRIGVFADLLD